MKKLSLTLMILSLLLADATAQNATKKNQYQVIGELGFPVKSDARVGWSGQLKWLTRLGPTADLTVSIGYSRFNDRDFKVDGVRSKMRLVPFLVGYRHHVVAGLFIEPQAGYGEIGGRAEMGGITSRPSIGAFMWGLGAGYNFQRIDVGIRYFGAHSLENSDAGTWYDMQFKYVGLFAALNLRDAWR